MNVTGVGNFIYKRNNVNTYAKVSQNNNVQRSYGLRTCPIDKVSFGYEFSIKNIKGLPDPCSDIILITGKEFNEIKWPKKDDIYSVAKSAADILKGKERFFLNNNDKKTLKILSQKPGFYNDFVLNTPNKHKNVINLLNDQYTDKLINIIKPFRKENMFDVEKNVYNELLSTHIANPNLSVMELFTIMRPKHEQALKIKQLKVLNKISKQINSASNVNKNDLHDILNSAKSNLLFNKGENTFKNRDFRTTISDSLKQSLKENLKKNESLSKFKPEDKNANKKMELLNKTLQTFDNITINPYADFDIMEIQNGLKKDIIDMTRNNNHKFKNMKDAVALKHDLMSYSNVILENIKYFIKPAKKISQSVEMLPKSTFDEDAFVIKYSEKVFDKKTKAFTDRDPVKIMQRFITPSVATVEHVFPRSPIPGISDLGGANSPMNYIMESEKYNSTRGSIPFYIFIKTTVPDMPKHAQKYMDKVISLINSRKVIDLDWYPAAIKDTLYKASKGQIDLDISKLKRQYTNTKIPNDAKIFKNNN